MVSCTVTVGTYQSKDYCDITMANCRLLRLLRQSQLVVWQHVDMLAWLIQVTPEHNAASQLINVECVVEPSAAQLIK